VPVAVALWQLRILLRYQSPARTIHGSCAQRAPAQCAHMLQRVCKSLKARTFLFNELRNKLSFNSSLFALRIDGGIGYSSWLGRSGERGVHRIPARACA
jgi:hypothetical protein